MKRQYARIAETVERERERERVTLYRNKKSNIRNNICFIKYANNAKR